MTYQLINDYLWLINFSHPLSGSDAGLLVRPTGALERSAASTVEELDAAQGRLFHRRCGLWTIDHLELYQHQFPRIAVAKVRLLWVRFGSNRKDSHLRMDTGLWSREYGERGRDVLLGGSGSGKFDEWLDLGSIWTAIHSSDLCDYPDHCWWVEFGKTFLQ